MPDHCCVPGCRGNYRATKDHPFEKVSVFTFPSDPELRSKWLRMIPRENLTVGAKTVVCEKHFAEQFIVRVDSVTRADGSVLSVRRKTPTLTKDAYPSIFPNLPAHLSEEPPAKRKTPDTRRAEISARDEQLFSDFLVDDKIATYEELCGRISETVSDYQHWITVKESDAVCLCNITFTETPRMRVVIRINKQMLVSVYNGELKLDSSALEWILGKSCTLTLWSQLTNLLSHFSAVAAGTVNLSVQDSVRCVAQLLRDLYRRLSDDTEHGFSGDVAERLNFLIQQLVLLFKLERRYSPEMLVFAFRLLCVSRASYSLVRDRMLQLPHISYLRKLSSIFNVNLNAHDTGHITYLREKAKVLQEHERHVILMLDEIHVTPKTTYKGGELMGVACNTTTEEATTVQTFMICSVLSKNKDVAAMLPVKGLTAEFLAECSLKIIKMLEDIGYFVLCLVSDNNRVNRNMFTTLCGGELQTSIEHPCSADRKLFFLFDSVHLLKSIRNNWLGQTDDDKTLTFPGLPGSDLVGGTLHTASFAHLRALHSSEKDNFVKLAPNLTYKALYPSNLERQNVKLALKVFDDKTIVALGEHGKQTGTDVSGTQLFLRIILKLWKILNVKTTGKGFRKRDDDCHPISDVSDSRLAYLNKVYKWLCDWEKLNQKQQEGRFTNETQVALKHTVKGYTELIPYLLTTLGMKYALPGKFQTDDLEARFGKHRRLAGTNYRISVREIKESEKKLTLISLLHVVSASRGKISLTDFISQCSESVESCAE